QESEGRCNDVCLALTYHRVNDNTVQCTNGGHCAMDNTCFCDGCKPVKRMMTDDNDDASLFCCLVTTAFMAHQCSEGCRVALMVNMQASKTVFWGPALCYFSQDPVDLNAQHEIANPVSVLRQFSVNQTMSDTIIKLNDDFDNHHDEALMNHTLNKNQVLKRQASNPGGKCFVRMQQKSKKTGYCKEIQGMQHCFIKNHGHFALRRPCNARKSGTSCVVEVTEHGEDVGKCQWHGNKVGCKILIGGKVLTLMDSVGNFELLGDECYILPEIRPKLSNTSMGMLKLCKLLKALNLYPPSSIENSKMSLPLAG
uniref:Uncharacterized protein n=1 Tax=Romanomermis culicivorax TaxID=13658 RepID=A0A915JKU4_ROMCU